jgi:hypothetical protein
VPNQWESTQPVRTDAGLLGLWQPGHFADVTEDNWDDRVAEDAALLQHIEAGAFVPVNIESDGSWQFTVRIGDPVEPLSDRERRYLTVSSEPYLLVAEGETALSGLERVGRDLDDDEVTVLPTEAGRYAVTIHMIDWMDEPGMVDDNDEPREGALPDFVIEIVPESGKESYRTKLVSFDRPED